MIIIKKIENLWYADVDGEQLPVSNPDLIEDLERYESEPQTAYRWNGTVERTELKSDFDAIEGWEYQDAFELISSK